MKQVLNENEKKLISSIRSNSRESINTIAKNFDTPKSTMFSILHRLENEEIVQHISHVSFDKIGYGVRIFVAIKTNPTSRLKVRHYLENCTNVNSLHEINTGFDYHFEALFRNQKEAHDFMTEFEANNPILQKNVYEVIDTLHMEKFLSNFDHFNEGIIINKKALSNN